MIDFSTQCTTNLELANRLKAVATDYKTLYVMGCFGAPMTASNKTRYCTNHDYNKKAERTAMIQAASEDTFGFDCVCLIKGILWGWSGKLNTNYGGASYKSNNVPDIGADSMIQVCSDISTDFSKIEIGEAVWMEGHIGVYVGGGLAVECTPKWDNKVQITACNQSVSGYNRRNWTKHGKLPYITYIKQEDVVAPTTTVVFDILDVVKIKEGVTTYANGKTMASWVPTAKLYVREVGTDKVTVSTLKEGAITGTVWAKDLELVEKAEGKFPSYNKGEVVQLSTNFKSTEFDCHGKDCCTITSVDPKLVELCQNIRDHFGVSVNINSGYRCEKHNAAIGGSGKSRHKSGQAADIRVTDVKPAQVAEYAEQIGILGIGLYETDSDGYFVHIDTRDTKSFWYGQAQEKRETFQLPKEEIKIEGTPSTGSEADQKLIWDFLASKIGNEYGTAGLMGNLYAECGLRSNNLQQTYEKSLGYTDETYTAAVDNGTYTNFVKDSAGYGLAQWTYWSRKEMLLNFAKEAKKSIGDCQMQLDFLWYELSKNYKSILEVLKNATSVREASDVVLHKYEAPADQSEAVEIKRAGYGQKYYDKFHTIEEPKEEEVITPPVEETPVVPPVEEPPVDTTPTESEVEFSDNWIKKLLIAIFDFLAKLLKKE